VEASMERISLLGELRERISRWLDEERRASNG
jgi:hypothetical protein